MNKSKIAIAVAVAALALSACSTTMTPPTAPMTVAPEKAAKNIPSWFIDQPESTPDAIYVVGTAVSRDIAMSVQKASVDAETHLATKIGGEISSMTKDYKREQGEEFAQSTEIVTNKIVAEVKIIGGVVDKKVIIPEGGGFRTYLLMRYPVTDNQLLKSYEAKKTFAGTKADAEAELEQKVQEKREPVAEKSKATVTPVVDTSNPYLVVKVTPAGDATEEN